MIIFIIWFSLCDTKATDIPVSRNAYYVGCTYNGLTHTGSVIVLCILAASELAFATFLAFKTRGIGKSYSKYSEYKQIGLSVYNIVLSALIGTIIFFLPSVDYYTRHYITASMIVWSTSFCFFALFSPKIINFFWHSNHRKDHQHNTNNSKNKVSDISGSGKEYSNYYSRSHHDNSSSSNSNNRMQQQSFGELLSLNGILNTDLHLDGKTHQPITQPSLAQQDSQYHLHHRQLYHRIQTTNPDSLQPILQEGGIVDGYEGHMPLQRVFRYFPFLSTWNMQQIVLLPDASYFSYFSEQSFTGSIFRYSHATIHSSKREAYLLKVHGYGLTDIFIQVKNEQDLQQWYTWFNSKKQHESEQNAIFSFLRKKSTKESTSATTTTTAHHKESILSGHHLNNKVNLDSGLTCQHLLADITESNRQSSITLDTLDFNDTPLQHHQHYNDPHPHRHSQYHHTEVSSVHLGEEENENQSSIPTTTTIINEQCSDRTLICTTSQHDLLQQDTKQN
ncbi:hypothetical protein BJ944DRAFT_272660 [Cunninghamella echinulata]|nr:hypothetical protein BJ944DRAFT_272660 [Cunninghamella echinulata]